MDRQPACDTLLTPQSPFSQKNIQECRCGTESCRGVLGPKPKKPVEEKSITSALIAGTKRKLQDFLGSGRVRSESNPSSPKKRRVHIGNSATTKIKKLDGASRTARERAEADAAEHSKQIASREDRAMKRSSTLTISKRLRPTVLRHTTRGTLRSTRHTTLSMQRKVVRPGALKAVSKPSRIYGALRHPDATVTGRRGLAPSNRPSTPSSSSGAEDYDSDSDVSPNITPASLRSASKDGKERASNFASGSQATPPRPTAKRGEAIRTADVGRFKPTRPKAAPTPRGIHDTDAGVEKPFHPAQSRPRTMRGR